MGLLGRRSLDRAVHLSKFSWLLERLPAGFVPVICTANASYTREVFEKIGPFKGDLFIGDAVLSWSACAAGITPWFAPNALVEHYHDGSLWEYLNEFTARGKECGLARIDFEGWSRGHALALAALCPGLVILTVAGIARYAFRAQLGGAFLRTLALQLALRGAWGIGEAWARADFAFGRLLRSPT